MRLRKKTTTPELPHRTPDPARELYAGYRKLLGDFVRTTYNYGAFLPKGLQVDLANHVEKIHKEGLAFMEKVGPEIDQ